MIDRGAQLSKFHRLLNTDDGKELMADLKIATMAYNAALLEAYRALESYQLAEDLQR